MGVTEAAEGGMACAGRSLEEIRAFSELMRSCEGLCEAASSEEEAAEDSRGPIDQFGGSGGCSQQGSPFSLFSGQNAEAVEGWDGIGGEMVLARQRQAVQKKPRGAGAQKKTASRGTAKMKAAADKELGETARRLRNRCCEKLEGQRYMRKAAFALAEGQIRLRGRAVVSRLLSMAERLASEPEWDGELDEAEAETGSGQREPEVEEAVRLKCNRRQAQSRPSTPLASD